MCQSSCVAAAAVEASRRASASRWPLAASATRSSEGRPAAGSSTAAEGR